MGIGGDYPVSATIERVRRQGLAWDAGDAGVRDAGSRTDPGPTVCVGAAGNEYVARFIWRLLVGFGAVPALAVYWSRRHLKETPRYLAATGQEEDESAGRYPRRSIGIRTSTAVSFWDGFHRLVSEQKLLVRLVGASAAWFLMDAAYYGNTVSSPLVLSALGSDHSLIQKTLTQ